MCFAVSGWRSEKLRATADWTSGDHVNSVRMREDVKDSHRDRIRGPSGLYEGVRIKDSRKDRAYNLSNRSYAVESTSMHLS